MKRYIFTRIAIYSTLHATTICLPISLLDCIKTAEHNIKMLYR